MADKRQSFALRDAYLCECGLVVNSAMQCTCGNTHGLLNLSAVLNRKKPVMAETAAVLAMMSAELREHLA
jgi:hypothetical protein